MKSSALKRTILDGGLDEWLVRLYGNERVFDQRQRYFEAVDRFSEIFGGDRDVALYSAPGRTEIAGNHTDHNNGKVLAASVNLDVIGVASANGDNIVRVQSKGYPMDIVSLDDLGVKEEEKNHSAALIRGMAKRFVLEGRQVGGFDAYTTSDVLKGSGLSSSAAFEVLVGTVMNHLFNGGSVDAVEIAKYAQYAENVYFGKPSGLMDQMASSVGGVIAIDFGDLKSPAIRRVTFDFEKLGCALCIVDTGGNHADLTHEYAAIPQEMRSVAALFGLETLRGLSMDALIAKAGTVRAKCGDRALLRAMHFLAENDRVEKIVSALEARDDSRFLALITESGNSSFRYLQNVYVNGSPEEQGLSVALFLAERFLNGKGACRVHGGGFGGTTQNFVPIDRVKDFCSLMEGVFGRGCCHVLTIRPVGGVQIAG